MGGLSAENLESTHVDKEYFSEDKNEIKHKNIYRI